MVKVLARTSAVELRLLASADELEPDGTMPSELGLEGIPVVPLPWKRLVREALWLGMDLPEIDRFIPSDCWVYCSMETYVPARRCKRIVTVHHLEPRATTSALSGRAFRQWRRDFRLRKALQTADLIVAQSTFTKMQVINTFAIPSETIQVVGGGVTEDCFDIRANHCCDSPVPDFSPYLVCTGAMEIRKGSDYLLDLAKALRRRGSPIRIVCTSGLYGDPRYISEARGLANVVLLGYVSRRELIAYYQKAVALLCLSRLEGFGIPLVEAMAAGLPVIAANSSAIPETLGGSGILVNPADTGQIIEEIGRLQANKELRHHLAAKGRDRARHYSWESCIDRLCMGIQRTTSRGSAC